MSAKWREFEADSQRMVEGIVIDNPQCCVWLLLCRIMICKFNPLSNVVSNIGALYHVVDQLNMSNMSKSAAKTQNCYREVLLKELQFRV